MVRTVVNPTPVEPRLDRSLPSSLIALAAMSTAASESAPQRIATIREQLKLLGDYL